MRSAGILGRVPPSPRATDSGATEPAGSDRRFALWLALLVAALFACITRGHIDNMDSELQFAATRNLVTEGDVTLAGTKWESHRYAIRGTDGRAYMPYGVGTYAIHAGPILIGEAISSVAGGNGTRIATFLASLVSPIALGATVGLLYLVLRSLGLTRKESALAAALHATATYALVYGRSTYYETTTGALLFAAFALPRLSPDSRRAALAGGLAAAAAVSMKVAHVVVLPALVVPLFFDASRRRFARIATFGAPVALVGVATLLIANARFGSPFDFGYGKFGGFGTPLGEGMARILVSGESGWFVLSPYLLLAVPGVVVLARRSPTAAATTVLAVAAISFLSARYDFPEGGTAYGARYLVPVTAFASVAAGMCLVSARGSLRAVCIALAAVSALIQIPGIVLTHQDYWQVKDTHTAAERERFPPRAVADSLLAWEKLRGRDDPYHLAALGIADDDRTCTTTYPALPGLSTWWARAVRHDRRPAMLLALLPFAALAFVALRRVRAGLRTTPSV